MRALVVHPGAHWATADVYRGWVRGLEANGVEVHEFNLEDRLHFYEHAKVRNDAGEVVKELSWEEAQHAASHGVLAAAYAIWPDLVVVISAAHTPPYLFKLMKDRGHHVVVVHTESPYEDERQVAFAALAEPDLNLINDPTHQAQFEQTAPTLYVPHAYDPAVHYPGDSEFESDAVFVGTGFPERVDYMEQVDWSGIDFQLGGMWSTVSAGSPLLDCIVHQHQNDCVDNELTAEMYRGSRVGFNIYRTTIDGRHSKADGWAVGPREIEMAACGLFFVRQTRPESDELFPFLPTFESPDELGGLIRRYLFKDDERADLAEQARAAIADRTFENHAKRLLERLF